MKNSLFYVAVMQSTIYNYPDSKNEKQKIKKIEET
jgi:hypothetical protein